MEKNQDRARQRMLQSFPLPIHGFKREKTGCTSRKTCGKLTEPVQLKPVMLPGLVTLMQSQTLVQSVLTGITHDMLIFSESDFKRRLIFNFTMTFLCQYTFKVYKYLIFTLKEPQILKRSYFFTELYFWTQLPTTVKSLKLIQII